MGDNDNWELNRVISIRANDNWAAWLDELADRADRTPADFIRDLIFCLKVTGAGNYLINTLIERDLSFADFARNAREGRE